MDSPGLCTTGFRHLSLIFLAGFHLGSRLHQVHYRKKECVDGIFVPLPFHSSHRSNYHFIIIDRII